MKRHRRHRHPSTIKVVGLRKAEQAFKPNSPSASYFALSTLVRRFPLPAPTGETVPLGCSSASFFSFATPAFSFPLVFGFMSEVDLDDAGTDREDEREMGDWACGWSVLASGETSAETGGEPVPNPDPEPVSPVWRSRKEGTVRKGVGGWPL